MHHAVTESNEELFVWYSDSFLSASLAGMRLQEGDIAVSQNILPKTVHIPE